ncbi:unnamed protein product [Rotaria sp. Silwood1]|nr:unnamed protein product [Rotaria sp. Silwood1]
MYLNTNRAKNTKNKLRINENLYDAQMKLLKEDIHHLKQEFLNIGNLNHNNQLLPSDGIFYIFHFFSFSYKHKSIVNIDNDFSFVSDLIKLLKIRIGKNPSALIAIRSVKHKRLKNDNEDLQHEFEHDRQRYLNTIRTQEKQLLLFCAILEKMSSTMQHNCNYGNIDKIIEQARYDEEKKNMNINAIGSD